VLTILAIIVLGTQPKEVPTALSARILDVGGFRVAWQRLLVLVSSLIVFWRLHRFVARTRTGRAMRAMSQNREACAVVGVDVQRVTDGDVRALVGPGRARGRARLAALQHLPDMAPR